MNYRARDLKTLQELLIATQTNYQEAKNASAMIDNYLGFKIEDVEKKLTRDINSDQQFWIGLDVQVMQTPFSEILEMIQYANLIKGQSVIDLGAAYGRMGIVVGALFPEINFLGYEIVKERVCAGNRIYKNWNFLNVGLEHVDLSNPAHVIPDADLYFIYDFGSKKDVYVVLEKLRIKSRERPIRVIARGGGVRNWIMQDFPWLSQFKPHERFDHWTLFRA